MKKKKHIAWIIPLIFVLAVIVGIVFLGSLTDVTSTAVSSEPLNRVHAGIDKCQICHEPIKEVRPDNCAARGCHTVDYFRDRIKEMQSPLLQHIRRRDCVDCHTEHKGKNGIITKPFDHKNLEKKEHRFIVQGKTANSPISINYTCQTCHILPTIHKEVAEESNCGECHSSTESFKKAGKK